MTGTGAATLLGWFLFILFDQKFSKAFIPKHVMANAFNAPKFIDFCLMFAGSTVLRWRKSQQWFR